MSYCEFKDCEGEATHSSGKYEICAKCYGAKRNVREIKGETMSNENENKSGKEIYKEYFNNWINAVGEEAQTRVNKNYMWGSRTIAENNEMTSCDQDCFYGLVIGNLTTFKRAPKTQIINGHEVVAPRYDSITNCTSDEICVFSSSEKDGVCQLNINLDNTSYCSSFGWFDSYGDCLAYANAHREDK